jgi:hypothetical protein
LDERKAEAEVKTDAAEQPGSGIKAACGGQKDQTCLAVVQKSEVKAEKPWIKNREARCAEKEDQTPAAQTGPRIGHDLGDSGMARVTAARSRAEKQTFQDLFFGSPLPKRAKIPVPKTRWKREASSS